MGTDRKSRTIPELNHGNRIAPTEVRFGSSTDVGVYDAEVRFTLVNRHRQLDCA
jgi:hypothetical protein